MSGGVNMPSEMIWGLLLLAIAATYLWRGLGTVIAARIDPESRLFQWIACVAYGLLAALISRIVFLPVGILEKTELVDRLGGVVIGFIVFLIFKRHIGVGTLTAAGVFMALVWSRGQGLF